MLFDVWGSDTLIHWAGWAMVFIGLIVLNEVGRRTKLGAAIIFGAVSYTHLDVYKRQAP